MTVSREKAQSSLNEVAKGYTVADDDDNDSADATDAVLVVDETTPDVAELKRKYLSDDGGDAFVVAPAGATYDLAVDAVADEDDGSGLVTIKSEAPDDPRDASTRDRTAVVSKQGRVIGLQG